VIATDGFTYEKRFTIYKATQIAIHFCRCAGASWSGSRQRGAAPPQALRFSGEFLPVHWFPLLSHARLLSLSLCDLMPARSADLIPNHSLKSQINQWREKMVRQSLVFSLVAAEHLPSGPRPCCSCFVASPGTSASTSRPRRYTDTICISRLRDSSSNARRNLFTGDCGQGG
jgi:hypothetical protein